jgi:hypothetical protein
MRSNSPQRDIDIRKALKDAENRDAHVNSAANLIVEPKRILNVRFQLRQKQIVGELEKEISRVRRFTLSSLKVASRNAQGAR